MCVHLKNDVFSLSAVRERAVSWKQRGGRECLVPIPRKLSNSWMAAELSHLLYNGDCNSRAGIVSVLKNRGFNLLEVLQCPPPFLGLILSLLPFCVFSPKLTLSHSGKLPAVTYLPIFQTPCEMTSRLCIIACSVSAKKAILYYWIFLIGWSEEQVAAASWWCQERFPT